MKLRSVSDFPSDRAYQQWSKQWLEANGLNDGYRYSVNLRTGEVTKGPKMNLPTPKLSKSNLPDDQNPQNPGKRAARGSQQGKQDA